MSQIIESMELLAGMKVAVDMVKEIAKDGKVDLSDLNVLVAHVNDLPKIADAFAGADQIPAEIKALDLAGAQELLGQVFAIIGAVKA